MHLSLPTPVCVLACAVALILSSACVGTMEERPPGQGGGASTAGVDAGGDCADMVPASQSGHHNPGTACQSCHAAGGGAPTFTLAGTLYDGLASDVPVAGATVHVIDADGVALSLLSAENGNFWTSQAIAFPITTFASGCPQRADMIAAVDEAGGDCNKGGCHAAGFRVYLPQ